MVLFFDIVCHILDSYRYTVCSEGSEPSKPRALALRPLAKTFQALESLTPAGSPPDRSIGVRASSASAPLDTATSEVLRWREVRREMAVTGGKAGAGWWGAKAEEGGGPVERRVPGCVIGCMSPQGVLVYMGSPWQVLWSGQPVASWPCWVPCAVLSWVPWFPNGGEIIPTS